VDEIRWRGTKQAAAYLGVTPRTLYRLIDQGDIPAYHMGRVFRLKQDDLDAFVERVRVAPGSLRHLYPDPSPSDEKGLAGSRRPGKPAHDGAPIAEEEER
jgi:excisionase family DNA binding protein